MTGQFRVGELEVDAKVLVLLLPVQAVVVPVGIFVVGLGVALLGHGHQPLGVHVVVVVFEAVDVGHLVRDADVEEGGGIVLGLLEVIIVGAEAHGAVESVSGFVVERRGTVVQGRGMGNSGEVFGRWRRRCEGEGERDQRHHGEEGWKLHGSMTWCRTSMKVMMVIYGMVGTAEGRRSGAFGELDIPESM